MIGNRLYIVLLVSTWETQQSLADWKVQRPYLQCVKISECNDITQCVKAVLPLLILYPKASCFPIHLLPSCTPFHFHTLLLLQILIRPFLVSAVHFQKNKSRSFIQLSVTAQNDIIQYWSRNTAAVMQLTLWYSSKSHQGYTKNCVAACLQCSCKRTDAALDRYRVRENI